MLFDLMSLCMIVGFASSCKYAKPLAASRAILSLHIQLNWIPDFPALSKLDQDNIL